MIKNYLQQAQGSGGHAPVLSKPGFPLLDSTGKEIGYIDLITVDRGRLIVEGWALAGVVGLASADQKSERVPHLPRIDVQAHLGDCPVQTPGFILDIPASLIHTVFWTEVGGIRYVYQLPKITSDELHAVVSA